TFGQATTTGTEPQFVTAPLAEPITIGGASELRAFIQGPSEAISGLLSADLVDIDPKGEAAIIGQSPKNVAANASSTQPVETKVPIAIAVPHTVPAGHQIGVRFRITFVGTSGHTLFYDSDEYPSGVKFQIGRVITAEDCPDLIDTSPGPVTQPSTPPPGNDGAPAPASRRVRAGSR
ncbi:MAG TPA: hypothetical protein VEG38_17210, partial [Acidimicrobiia bacterium]|nr:hypothetical protein [Acidimicrobiia bacterium]